MDYTSNTKKEKMAAIEKPEKNIERVTTDRVLVKKKGVGSKFKEVFIMADFRSVFTYVITDVLVPAARNMIVDGATKGIERIFYGNTSSRTRGYPGQPTRVTYNDPINRSRSYRDVTSRSAPMPTPGSRAQRAVREEFIISSREECETVLERMQDVLDTYDVVSVADFNELVGFQSEHTDNKWGWTFLGDVQIRQIREGYIIDLPPAEYIQ